MSTGDRAGDRIEGRLTLIMLELAVLIVGVAALIVKAFG